MKLAAFFCCVLAAAPAFGLDVQIKDVRGPAAVVTTTIELADLIPDRVERMLDRLGHHAAMRCTRRAAVPLRASRSGSDAPGRNRC